MLEVQKFLKGAGAGSSPVMCLETLKTQFGIKYNADYPDLIVLNYCQIDSPKHHAITKECRSLVLEAGTWEIVSRSFDRFLNLGEEGCEEIDWNNAIAHSKIDGSLIGIFNYKGKWLYRTRSVIMPDSQINGELGARTWKEVIEEAVRMDRMKNFREDFTFIGEVTCKDNRVVTKYEDEPTFYLHAIRNNVTGDYREAFKYDHCSPVSHWVLPEEHKFDTMDHILESAKNLRELKEGYVIYCGKDHRPLAKVKNPAYVAAHHLKGECGLTERRVLDLMLMKEQDEYLSIFPEDKEKFEPYEKAWEDMWEDIDKWELITYNMRSESQKDFAMVVKDLPISSILFKNRQGIRAEEAFYNLTTPAKYKIILAYKK
jgi:hypothetical protein